MRINDDWEITSDALNVVLSQRKMTEPKDGSEGKEYWKIEGYYPDVQGALRALVKKEVLGTGMTDLQTVCERIDALDEVIKGLVIA